MIRKHQSEKSEIRNQIHPEIGDLIYRGDDGNRILGSVSRNDGGRIAIASQFGFIQRPGAVSRVIESGISIRNSMIMKTGDHRWRVVAEQIQ